MIYEFAFLRVALICVALFVGCIYSQVPNCFGLSFVFVCYLRVALCFDMSLL